MSYEAARMIVRSTQMSFDHMLMSAAMRRDFNEVVAVREFSNTLYDRIGEIKSTADADRVLNDMRRVAGDLHRGSDDQLAPVYMEIDALLTEQITALAVVADNPDQLSMDEHAMDEAENALSSGNPASMAFDAATRGLDLVTRQAALRVNSPTELDEAIDWVDRARQSIAIEYLTLSHKENLTADDVRDSMLIAMGVPTSGKPVSTLIPDFVRSAGISNLIPRGFDQARRVIPTENARPSILDDQMRP